jgi:hypothetical protein
LTGINKEELYTHANDLSTENCRKTAGKSNPSVMEAEKQQYS